MTKDIGDRSPRSPGEATASARPVPPALAAAIEDLERAAEGSRELDAWVFCAVEHPDKKPQRNFFYTNREEWGVFVTNQPLPGLTFYDAPHYTTSLDAAMSLVPEGWRLCEMNCPSDEWQAGVISQAAFVSGFHAQMPLALCIAALKARLSSLQGESDREASRSSPSDGSAGDAGRNGDQS